MQPDVVGNARYGVAGVSLHVVRGSSPVEKPASELSEASVSCPDVPRVLGRVGHDQALPVCAVTLLVELLHRNAARPSGRDALQKGTRVHEVAFEAFPDVHDTSREILVPTSEGKPEGLVEDV